MARGKVMSDDLRGAILNMARTLDIANICHYTGCKTRTVQRILEDYRMKGTVMREHLKLEMRGAKRGMSSSDIRFLTGVVRHSPDVYLDELREIIEEKRGTEVSEATIWRTLRRCGFTMKKVCDTQSRVRYLDQKYILAHPRRIGAKRSKAGGLSVQTWDRIYA
ncbi:Homeodomain-like protein [Mycena sanguinolenta]|nr:Homeodomain-like protein [Mycena sanguinolenta]